MTDLARLRTTWGKPPTRPERSFTAVEDALGVHLPNDCAAFALTYGDTAVDDYLFI